jgi:hypothetical protein
MRNVCVANALNRVSVGCSMLVMACAIGIAQQRTPSAPEVKPGPMPQDRIADSYAIYSQLLPGNQIEWGDAPRSQWLVEDTTTAVPPDKPCLSGEMMNPHQATKPPQERQADFAEVLADYDDHCHARYQLDGSKFRLKLPVRLLDEDARQRYVSGVSVLMPPRNDIMRAPPTPDKFKGAAGMHSFTAVYFNRAHTLAMTEIGMYCGSLCGNSTWVILEKKSGEWKILPWVVTATFS